MLRLAGLFTKAQRSAVGLLFLEKDGMYPVNLQR